MEKNTRSGDRKTRLEALVHGNDALQYLIQSMQALRGWTGALTPEQLSALRFATLSLSGLDSATTHPNGFSKCTLWESSNGEESLRLHLWPSGGRSQDANIHGHAWNFTSAVLAGSLEQRKFSAIPDKKGEYIHAKYISSSSRELHSTEVRSALVSNEESRYRCGSVYSLRKGEIHFISPSEEEVTVTLVYTSERDQNTEVDVFIKRKSAKSQAYRPETHFYEQLSGALSHLPHHENN